MRRSDFSAARAPVSDDDKKQLINDFAWIANTDQGRAVLNYIMNECGWHFVSVTVDPKTAQIFTDNTVYNEARRNLWFELRQKITDYHNLVKIEMPEPPPIVEENNNDISTSGASATIDNPRIGSAES